MMNAKRILAVLLACLLVTSLCYAADYEYSQTSDIGYIGGLSVLPSDETFEGITIPVGPNHNTANGCIPFKAVAKDADKVEFLIDGEVLYSFTGEEGMCEYSAYIDLSNIRQGYRFFSVEKTVGGIVTEIDSKYLYLSGGRFKGALVNRYGDTATDGSGEKWTTYAVSDFETGTDLGFEGRTSQSSSTTFGIGFSAGGKGTGYALTMVERANNADGLIGKLVLIEQEGGTSANSQYDKHKGTYEIEFDLYLHRIGTEIGLAGFPLWCDPGSSNAGSFVLPDGKLLASDYTFTAKKWTHVKMEFTIPDSGAPFWNVYIDGVKKISNAERKGSNIGDHSGNWKQIYLYLRTNSTDNGSSVLNQFNIDNLRVSRQYDGLPNVISIGVVTEDNGAPKDLNNGYIPTNSKKIVLTFDKAYTSVTSNDIVLRVDGEDADATGAVWNSDEKTLTVPVPSGITADSLLTVAVGESAKLQHLLYDNSGDIADVVKTVPAMKEVGASFKLVEPTKFELKDFSVDGNNVTINIHNGTVDNKVGTLYIAAYNDNELVALACKPYIADALSFDNITSATLEGSNEATSYKAMYWDDNLKPHAVSLSIEN